jgi:hypothetical protein
MITTAVPDAWLLTRLPLWRISGEAARAILQLTVPVHVAALVATVQLWIEVIDPRAVETVEVTVAVVVAVVIPVTV